MSTTTTRKRPTKNAGTGAEQDKEQVTDQVADQGDLVAETVAETEGLDLASEALSVEPGPETTPAPAEPSDNDLARAAVLEAFGCFGADGFGAAIERAAEELEHLSPERRGSLLAAVAVGAMGTHSAESVQETTTALLAELPKLATVAVPRPDPVPALVALHVRRRLLAEAADMLGELLEREKDDAAPWQAEKAARLATEELARLSSASRWANLRGALVDLSSDALPRARASAPAARGRRGGRARLSVVEPAPSRGRGIRNVKRADWGRAIGAVFIFKGQRGEVVDERGTFKMGAETFKSASKAAEKVAGYPLNARTAWALVEPFGDHQAGATLGEVVAA